ncbi:MAG: glycerophosphodiester phosphodiesterase [Acidimicrobiia bacterium]|nr:glycerophosphodiester phosphodiesterase [Acidimicrobiia bacterium]MYC58508.1 glycerophosphodiester phosphodiesterase [Acidimicrobiia bacterium]MYG94266.1 glycerophosphodiester phosphodiesterase [Acidimicrobiia bacterium]MYI30386.1 glycerophosphodiester phosphodiesterase [Acidimicrobiia bacterium]
MSRWAYLEHEGPIPIAHRGGAAEGSENTMAAFATTIAMGYRYLETDVQLTRDGVLVVFHDQNLQRLCGQADDIANLTWRDVTTLRINGTHLIPRFEEVLEEWPDIKIAVDPKHYEATAPLIEVLQRANAIKRVCVGSFVGRRLRMARHLGGPELCTSLSPWEIACIQFASYGPYWRSVSGVCAQVPSAVWGVPIVHRRFVHTAHKMGLAVHVWTIDDPVEMHRLLDMGVDGIMTDRPSVLRNVLIARGCWA